MKNTSVGLFCSAFAVMAVCVGSADAAIRVGNASRSNAQAYQQVNEMRYGAVPENQVVQPTTLPINVTNSELAQQIIDGNASSGVGIDTLEQCSMIYPTGTFEWARPTLGRRAGASSMCTAVVEMRALGAGQNGEDIVVARANLAAGDSMKCNISSFPEGAWLPAAGNIVFPADAAPTMEDVIAVMNEEQKQNAALKIIGGVILGGLGGNMTGANDAGNSSLLGTDKDKMKNTAIGAGLGAAVMLGNTYGGKVAGDMILSTGVNAAAGGVVGNVIASGDSVLRIENCVVEDINTTCLWGYYKETEDMGNRNAYVNVSNINDFLVCESDGTNGTDDKKCEYKRLSGGMPDGWVSGTKRKSDNRIIYTLEDAYKEDPKFSTITSKYCYKDGDMINGVDQCSDNKNIYIKLQGAQIVKKRTPAMIVGVEDKAFGYKNWADLRKNLVGKKIVGRSGNGTAQDLNITVDGEIKDELVFAETDGDFEPMTLDAEDGGIIDLDNKARLKDTLTGAGVGGALGAYSAYQGAQDDVTQRWLAETQAYKDSLYKVICATGTRFLSAYNDEIMIPTASGQ